MIAVLIPVLGRPQQIEPLLTSIANATTTPYRAVLICSPKDRDALNASLASDADTIVTDWKPDKADYARKLALGYAQTDEPWLFQGATDLRFYRDWDTAALKLGQTRSKGVVGTNDLGNPLVKRGRHSTHTLISRDYIETWGGTVDGSGVIFSEAYDHQWSDNEFIETAIRRRQFVFARNSIVEHLHPHWNKGEMDATYDKALRQTTQDITTFQQRRRAVQQASWRSPS